MSEDISMTSRFVLAMLLIAALVSLVPNSAAASTENKTSVFEIKNVYEFLSGTKEPQETVEVQEIDPNIAILQEYLEQKGSPLADYSSHLLKQENWKLVLAISNGESTMCKHQLYNNCWGIGGAWNLKRYASLTDAITDANRLLTEKYVASGANTPTKIVRKYVGNYSPTWVRAVSQTLNQLNNLPLVN